MTVSQVWAFWPPPCRKTTSGDSAPHFTALISPISRRRATGSLGHPGLFGVLVQQREFVQAEKVVV